MLASSLHWEKLRCAKMSHVSIDGSVISGIFKDIGNSQCFVVMMRNSFLFIEFSMALGVIKRKQSLRMRLTLKHLFFFFFFLSSY